MPADSDDGLKGAHRHDVLSSLTVIRAQTQLLQRRLARMNGFADGDRAWLVKGLPRSSPPRER